MSVRSIGLAVERSEASKHKGDRGPQGSQYRFTLCAGINVKGRLWSI